MYFENEKTQIEILVGGYTDDPDYYGGSIGKNALTCQTTYQGEEIGTGVLWDELFQTEDITRLHEMAVYLLDGKTDSFSYKDQWNMVLINAKQDVENYQIEVSVMARGPGEYKSGAFVYSRQQLEELVEELEEYKNRYPVIL